MAIRTKKGSVIAKVMYEYLYEHPYNVEGCPHKHDAIQDGDHVDWDSGTYTNSLTQEPPFTYDYLKELVVYLRQTMKQIVYYRISEILFPETLLDKDTQQSYRPYWIIQFYNTPVLCCHPNNFAQIKDIIEKTDQFRLEPYQPKLHDNHIDFLIHDLPAAVTMNYIQTLIQNVSF